MGFSAGADIVTLAASDRNDIAGVVTIGGGVLQLDDYLQLTGEADKVEKNIENTCTLGAFEGRSGEFWRQLLFSNLQQEIMKMRIPYLAIQGSDDSIIRWDLTRPYAEEMKQRFRLFDYRAIQGMGHGLGWNPSRWRVIHEWINRH